MASPSVILSAVVAAATVGYEIDYNSLPAANTLNKGYTFTLVFQFAGYQDYEYPMYHSKDADTSKVASLHALGLEDTGWRWKQDGNKIIVYGLKDVRLVRLKVTGDGPKPTVRPVFATPQDLKPKPAEMPKKKQP